MCCPILSQIGLHELQRYSIHKFVNSPSIGFSYDKKNGKIRSLVEILKGVLRYSIRGTLGTPFSSQVMLCCMHKFCMSSTVKGSSNPKSS